MTKRRYFFKEFLSRLYVLAEEAKGNRHFKLPDLWKLDDDKFKQLKFRVREGVAIRYNQKEIRALKNKTETFLLCAKDTEKEKIFQSMQQRLTVGEIAEQLASEDERDAESRFQDIREFMLSLVNQAICVPANDMHYESEND